MYSKPTTVLFKTRFPEFKPVLDELVQMVIDETEPAIGESWPDPDRRAAVMYLVAHKLAMEGEPQRTIGAGTLAGLAGPIKRHKVGDTEFEYQTAVERYGANQKAGGSNDYALTPYGKQYAVLLRRNFIGIVAV